MEAEAASNEVTDDGNQSDEKGDEGTDGDRLREDERAEERMEESAKEENGERDIVEGTKLKEGETFVLPDAQHVGDEIGRDTAVAREVDAFMHKYPLRPNPGSQPAQHYSHREGAGLFDEHHSLAAQSALREKITELRSTPLLSTASSSHGAAQLHHPALLHSLSSASLSNIADSSSNPISSASNDFSSSSSSSSSSLSPPVVISLASPGRDTEPSTVSHGIAQQIASILSNIDLSSLVDPLRAGAQEPPPLPDLETTCVRQQEPGAFWYEKKIAR